MTRTASNTNTAINTSSMIANACSAPYALASSARLVIHQQRVIRVRVTSSESFPEVIPTMMIRILSTITALHIQAVSVGPAAAAWAARDDVVELRMEHEIVKEASQSTLLGPVWLVAASSSFNRDGSQQ